MGFTACLLPATSAHATDGSVRLRVMTLNIFYGGDELDLRTGDWCALRRGCSATFEQVIRTIRASDADVIGLEEAEHSTRRVARALGWYASERLQSSRATA